MIRLIKHERVPGTGSFEVRFADDRRSAFFYFEDLPSRRLRQQMVGKEALDCARMFARIMSGLIEGWFGERGTQA
ncbi:hypothetical protein QA645_19525 [Bradyrhizobium sp. CIAT3101]|uniref:hypothetical protein n=1 Tax=Bradyrhizobium sp. CIAT3101 TaxID=439387 RepID=UPI0024B06471|nr:hypothetical protein [Bradyrhizobium sp. CIAT3101]WFU84847.1 hypothetical protein QA645_19525 [Bradyrhizobium sp. CIAT3101]